MVNKNKNGDLYSMWYDISNEIGKQFLDISNVNNLNYGGIQETWKGYSEKVSEQISKFVRLDENYYKNIATLWNEFTESMNSQIPTWNNYSNEYYNNWYENWLEYTDKISKGFTEIVHRQFKQRPEINDINDLWLSRFGFTDKQKQQLLDLSEAISEYWLDVITKSTEIVKDSFNPENHNDLQQKFKEFYDFWTDSYSNTIERIMKIYGYENWNEQYTKYPFPSYDLVQEFFTNHFKALGLNQYYEYDKVYKMLEELKEEVYKVTKELTTYKNQPTSRKKK